MRTPIWLFAILGRCQTRNDMYQFQMVVILTYLIVLSIERNCIEYNVNVSAVSPDLGQGIWATIHDSKYFHFPSD